LKPFFAPTKHIPPAASRLVATAAANCTAKERLGVKASDDSHWLPEGRFIGFAWEARRNEPGREGTLQHAR
jgi:hypothetical protein